MFVRTKTSPNSPRKTVQIVESKRVDGKIRQRIVQHVGVAANEEELHILMNLGKQLVEELEKAKEENSSQLKLFNDEDLLNDGKEIEQKKEQNNPGNSFEQELSEDCNISIVRMLNEGTVIDGPMEVVEVLFSQLGLNRIFVDATRYYGKITLLKQALAATLATPSSKRGMVRWLSEQCSSDVSLDRLYRFMDALAKKETRVKEVIRNLTEKLIPEAPSLMLFDVTTLYFESFTEDELRQCGYSISRRAKSVSDLSRSLSFPIKDNKFKETQIVLAMATDTEGLPIWYEIFPGKTSEGATLDSFAAAWRKKEYPGSKGVVVADRAMGMVSNVELMREKGLDYVFGAKLKSMKSDLKREILKLEAYSELQNGVKYRILKHEDGSSILVTWEEKRAKKDKFDREKLLARAEKKLNKSGIVRGKNLIANRGSARYFQEVGDSKFVIDEAKVNAEAEWDGLHGLKTSLSLETPEEVEKVLAHYASLWRIEESFRINKHNLKIRPVYHWTEQRIRGHIALSYLAFACMRILERRVELQQKERASPEELRNAMLSVTSTIMRDKRSDKLYRFPKRLGSLASKLYRSLGIKHSTSVKEITSMEKYRNRTRYSKERTE